MVMARDHGTLMGEPLAHALTLCLLDPSSFSSLFVGNRGKEAKQLYQAGAPTTAQPTTPLPVSTEQNPDP